MFELIRRASRRQWPGPCPSTAPGAWPGGRGRQAQAAQPACQPPQGSGSAAGRLAGCSAAAGADCQSHWHNAGASAACMEAQRWHSPATACTVGHVQRMPVASIELGAYAAVDGRCEATRRPRTTRRPFSLSLRVGALRLALPSLCSPGTRARLPVLLGERHEPGEGHRWMDASRS